MTIANIKLLTVGNKNMPVTTYQEIIFISGPSLQSSLFKDYLEKYLDITIKRTTIQSITDNSLPEKSEVLVIIDQNHFENHDIENYIDFVTQYSLNTYEVLINSHQDISADDLSRWPNTVGAFFCSDELDAVVKGMKKIIDGELWLSRKLTKELIIAYRSKENIVPKTPANLTSREQEIMQLLVLGASNNQIAEELFVSENTVKTHLHNVFKKIKVKNRLQAFMWAKNNHYNELPV
ncbi:LuxR C-terminal-related transcriptional regulator [Pseudomonadota bacterium]